MNHITGFFLLIISPILAVLLALLGVETLNNPLGWFLLLVGVAYIGGVGIVYFIRKERFWESSSGEITKHEVHGDRSFWFITIGIIAAFFLPPIEYLYISAILPRNDWMSSFGLVLVTFGMALFIWARSALSKNYSGHLSLKSGQVLVQSGPYRFIRHPAYAGFLLMALGISLGFSSLAGLATIFVLLPGSIYLRFFHQVRLR